MDTTLSDGKILIEPIINKKVHGVATHGKTFRYGLRIRNIDERISPDFVIQNVTLESAAGQNIVATEGKAFFVPRLNSSEEKYFDLGVHGSFMHGLVKIGADVAPSDRDKVIACYQRRPFTDSSLYVNSNAWIDFFYIKTPQDIAQELIIKRLQWLTIIVLLFIAGTLAFKLYL
jgi:hypothetical protein